MSLQCIPERSVLVRLRRDSADFTEQVGVCVWGGGALCMPVCDVMEILVHGCMSI